jgi:Tol biopolymer transport system component
MRYVAPWLRLNEAELMTRVWIAALLGFVWMPQAAPPAAPAVTGGSHPVVSPDGRRILFLSDRSGATDLYVIESDGTGEKQITHTPEPEALPAWASNDRIVFSLFGNETSRIFAMDADGARQWQIGSVPGRSAVPSPDGTRVLYATGSWTSMSLMVANADGTRPQRLNDGSSIAWNCQWSPDGTRIAFTGRTSDGALQVFVMNADGSARRQLTHLAAADGNAQVPAWSRDGRQIAFQSNGPGAHLAHIWTADLAGSAAHRLASHSEPYLDETPSWFPDGRRLAFQSDRTGRMEVWVMNADGTGVRQITGRPKAPQPASAFTVR